jgi:type IV pilus assembly protein PilB
MPESIARNRIGAMTYLAPAGPLITDEAVAALTGAVASCIAAQHIDVVLDFGQVAVVNGKAMGAMLALQSKLAAIGGRLKIINPNALVRDIFVATGFCDYVAVVDAASGEMLQVSSSAARTKEKLGDILVEMGLVTSERIAEAARLQSELGKRLGQILVERGWVSERSMMQALSAQLGVPYVKLREGMYEPQTIALIERGEARRMQVLPMFLVNGTLTVATTDPQFIPSFDEIQVRTGHKIRLVLAPRGDILRTLAEAHSGGQMVPDLLESLADDIEVIENQIPDDYTAIDQMAEGSPVINLVNSVIQRAIQDKASDIHIEVSRNRSRVRFRIDGILYEVMTPRHELHPAIVSRIKVMANLDITERRMPQDGRIQVATQGRTVDLRFSSLPGIYGEKVVLRVLDKNQSILDVDKLGMSTENLTRFKKLLTRTHGLILVTGPTGSGKTTTLYAAINQLRSLESNIVTIEDPVEYQLDIVNQNQVNDGIGLSFAKLLKHVLRQDPDIIMVGEIRDKQTAEIAVQAALTGHLVLTTLHTNDAVGAVSRMVEMGVEPYLLSSALIGVVAQRLVRQVCSDCKTTYLASAELARLHGRGETEHIRLTKGRGCAACYDSGYKGRIGIHELLDVDAGLQRLIISNPVHDELAAYSKERGYRSLYADGLARSLTGETTLEEISRVMHSE